MSKLPLNLLLAASLVAAACVAARGQSANPSPVAAARPQGQPPESSPELTEAARLSREVVRLYSTGKFEDALPLAERALSLLMPYRRAKVDAVVADRVLPALLRGG